MIPKILRSGTRGKCTVSGPEESKDPTWWMRNQIRQARSCKQLNHWEPLKPEHEPYRYMSAEVMNLRGNPEEGWEELSGEKGRVEMMSIQSVLMKFPGGGLQGRGVGHDDTELYKGTFPQERTAEVLGLPPDLPSLLIWTPWPGPP